MYILHSTDLDLFSTAGSWQYGDREGPGLQGEAYCSRTVLRIFFATGGLGAQDTCHMLGYSQIFPVRKTYNNLTI